MLSFFNRLGFGAAALALLVAPASAASGPRLHVETEDVSPRFLKFYEAAHAIEDPQQRFALWKQMYGFAAVPPGPQADMIARRQLDGAWNRYPQAIAAIQTPKPLNRIAETTLARIAALLNDEKPIDVKLVRFVGTFGGGAFTYSMQGRPVINVPVEMSAERQQLSLTHELAHAVHISKAGLSGQWERSGAVAILMEGLAMHVAREIRPGLDTGMYGGGGPAWWATVKDHRSEVLVDVLPLLERRDGPTLLRLLVGSSSTGLRQEGYAAGWFVVQAMRDRGMTLAEIASVPEREIPALVRSACVDKSSPL